MPECVVCGKQVACATNHTLTESLLRLRLLNRKEFPVLGLINPSGRDRRLPMHMTTGTRQVGGVTIVDISGRIVLGEESAALRELVCDLLSKGHKMILF